MIERQVITTWYRPEEKVPADDLAVVATISGKAGNVTFNHAIVILYYAEGEGWGSTEYDFDELTVHAWADLEPYKGD